jgi:transporter family-2 protein
MNPAVLVPIALVFAGGALISLQAPTNSMLARAGGSPVLAALISFAVGTLALFVVWLGSGNRPGFEAFAKLPYLAWIGGLYGAFFVAVAAFAAPRIGLASLITVGIAGQVVMALVLDHFGMLGLPKDAINATKVAGAVLVLAGVVLVRKG